MRGIDERILKLENKCDEIKAEVAKDAQTNQGAFLFLRDEQAERHMMLRNAIDGLATRIERLENARAEDKNSLEDNSDKTAENPLPNRRAELPSCTAHSHCKTLRCCRCARRCEFADAAAVVK